MRVVSIVLLSISCGRLSFDPRASSSDAASDGTAELPLNCSGRLICDGFEIPNSGNWNKITGNGTIVYDSIHTHRGALALHVHTDSSGPGNTRKAELSETTSLPNDATPRVLYARSWGYFPSPHANAYNQFITFANTSGNGFAMGDRNLNITTNHFNAVDFGESNMRQLPRDRWVCLQFEAPTNQNGTVRAFVDGTEVADIALAVTTPEAAMTQIFIGLDWPGLSMSIPAIDVWFDDIIVDDSPISCAD